MPVHAAVLMTIVVLAQAGAGIGQELVRNGGFDQPAADGKRPEGFSLQGNVEWIGKAGNMWIRIRDSGAASQKIPLQPQWWKIEVSVRVRCQDVQQGKQSWYDARVG